MSGAVQFLPKDFLDCGDETGSALMGFEMRASGAGFPDPGFPNVPCECSVRVIILTMMLKKTKYIVNAIGENHITVLIETTQGGKFQILVYEKQTNNLIYNTFVI